MQAMRYTAVANDYAKFNNLLTVGISYIVVPDGTGCVDVYDYSGNYIGVCRSDEFDNYRLTTA